MRCEHVINRVQPCSLDAKIKITRPSPIDPNLPPKYVCYSHLMTVLKRTTGQLLLDKVKDW